MSSILTIARHEYLTNVRRTGFIAMTAIVPLIMVAVLLVAAVFGGQAGAFFEQQFGRDRGVVGVVDRQGAFTPLLPELRSKLRTFVRPGNSAIPPERLRKPSTSPDSRRPS